MMKKYVEIKVNQDMGIHKEGDKVKVPSDEFGTPKEKFWRNRLRDSKIDNCCELVVEKAKGKAKEKDSK